MEPSSRTPEGEPNRCPVCGSAVRVDPSRPPGDAPCPHCGHLLWFERRKGNAEEETRAVPHDGLLELVQMASEKFSEEEMEQQAARLRQGQFTFVDYKKMLLQTMTLGPLRKIIRMLGNVPLSPTEAEHRSAIRRLIGVIDAMTPEERQDPNVVVSQSRELRISRGGVLSRAKLNPLSSNLRRWPIL
jgi:hypothetical protein